MITLLRRIFKSRGVDKTVYACVVILTIFGIVMIGSASVGQTASMGAAYATINIKNMIAVNSIRIMDSIEGMFITMPSFRKGEEYVSICSPITKEFGNLLKEIILEAYQEKMREYIMKRPEDLEKEKEESVNEPE